MPKIQGEDNIRKLGYGGTKEEMQRLLKDAEKISGVKYDISSFADITQAIHVMQEEMGIAGATAAEAATTIEGSLGMMKGAWQNLVVGMADENADIGGLINNLVDSTASFAKNIIPRIEQALQGVGRLVEGLAPIVAGALPGLVSSVLPALLSAAVELLNSVVSALPGLISTLTNSVIPSLLSGLESVIGALISALPMVISSIAGALPTLLPMLLSSVISLVVLLSSELPNIIQPIIAMLPSLLLSVADALLSNLGILIEALSNLVVALLPMIPQILLSLIQTVPQIWFLIASALIDSAPTLWEALKNIVVTYGKELLNYYMNLVPAAYDALKPLLELIGDLLVDLWAKIKAWGADVMSGVASFGGKIAMALLERFNIIKSNFVTVFDGIKAIAQNAWENIKDKMTTPIIKAVELIKSGLDKIKSFFSNLKLKLPDIKLPHFSINGEFSLNPPSVPKLGIEWYATAMNSPMVLNKATVFGFNSASGKFMGGGEAGSEVVAGTNTLMNMIGDVVDSRTAAQNDRIEALLTALLNAINGGNAELINAVLADKSFSVSGREFGRLVREYA